MEITLFHRAFVALKASEIALGCLLLARYITKQQRCTKEETPLAVQIAQMLDGHLAEHLEQLSTIVLKKCESFRFSSLRTRLTRVLSADSLTCFGNVSTTVREWYLAGNRFDLFKWPAAPQPFWSASTLSTLAPSYPMRRDSSFSSILSGSPSSSSHYNGSSSDDEDAPLTPSTPLTQYGSDEINPMSIKRSSPLARHVVTASALAAEAGRPYTKEITPPSAAGLSVKLVPTSGPSMTLC